MFVLHFYFTNINHCCKNVRTTRSTREKCSFFDELWVLEAAMIVEGKPVLVEFAANLTAAL